MHFCLKTLHGIKDTQKKTKPAIISSRPTKAAVTTFYNLQIRKKNKFGFHVTHLLNSSKVLCGSFRETSTPPNIVILDRDFHLSTITTK